MLRPPSLWTASTTGVAALLAIPVLTIAAFLFSPATDVWQHLKATVLSDYILNTLLLSLGVATGTLVIGTATAWLTTMYRFPGRTLFQWALLLPMAIPAYIIAFTYTGLLESTGPVQHQLRELTGWSYGDYWFPDLRSMGGAIAMLTLVLYPYVYLLARASFLEQSICVLDVGRTLGLNAWQRFYRIALPLARPGIVAGLSLVLMEVLADYGTVQYFGISTFTTGIFRTWFGLDDAAAAANLSAILLGLVFICIVLERYSRRQSQYFHTSQRHQRIRPTPLCGLRKLGASLACLLPLLFGFIIPVGQLGYWAWKRLPSVDQQFMELCWHSFWLAGLTALIAVSLAALMAYGKRIQPSPWVRSAVRIAGLGYAIPGTVIAVGVMIPAGLFDQWLNDLIIGSGRQRIGLVLSGTFTALIFAYLVRFMAVSLQSVESGLGKVKMSLDDAARSMGASRLSVLFRVHLPLMRGTLLTAILIVFVDVLKELPATLVMRPFNFNTLAVRAYELASDERLADAALPAIAIVLTGIVPVILLSRSISRVRAERKRPGAEHPIEAMPPQAN